MKLILVPTDMSETAAHALRYAAAIAEQSGAHLLVLYADPFVPPLDFAGTSAYLPRREDLIASAREQLEIHVEQNVRPSVPYDARVLAQSPVDAIIEQACDCGADLIVMGTHGRTGVRHFIIGSLTEAVMRQATVPVIAVNTLNAEIPTVNKVVCPIRASQFTADAIRAVFELGGDPRLLLAQSENAEEILAFATQRNANLIAVGVPAAPHLLPTLLHRSPCPVLTANEHVRFGRSPHDTLRTANHAVEL